MKKIVLFILCALLTVSYTANAQNKDKSAKPKKEKKDIDEAIEVTTKFREQNIKRLLTDKCYISVAVSVRRSNKMDKYHPGKDKQI